MWYWKVFQSIFLDFYLSLFIKFDYAYMSIHNIY